MTFAQKTKVVGKWLLIGLVGALWIHCGETEKAAGHEHVFIGILGGSVSGIALGVLLCLFRDSGTKGK